MEHHYKREAGLFYIYNSNYESDVEIRCDTMALRKELGFSLAASFFHAPVFNTIIYHLVLSVLSLYCVFQCCIVEELNN